MKYKVLISKQVQKFLDKLPKEYIINFKDKVDILSLNPFSRDNNLDIVPINGLGKNFYRLRIGDYRFIYEIRKSEILIYFFKADNRGDIY